MADVVEAPFDYLHPSAWILRHVAVRGNRSLVCGAAAPPRTEFSRMPGVTLPGLDLLSMHSSHTRCARWLNSHACLFDVVDRCGVHQCCRFHAISGFSTKSRSGKPLRRSCRRAPNLPTNKSGGFQEVKLMLAHHFVGRCPEPSPCGYVFPATDVASLLDGRPAPTYRSA